MDFNSPVFFIIYRFIYEFFYKYFEFQKHHSSPSICVGIKIHILIKTTL